MRPKVILPALAVTLCFLSIALPAQAVYGAEDTNSCAIEVNNPHPSVGAGGIIAKVNWQCSDVTPNRSLYYALHLYRCPMSDPQRDYEWLYDHCYPKAFNGNPDRPVTSTAPVTAYVPDSNLPGVHGTGYWIAEAIWTSSYADGSHSSVQHVKYSDVVYLSV
jgi:hypothetical protein